MEEKEILKEQIKCALIQLYSNDEGLNIDMEYNKNGEGLKFIDKGKSASQI